MNFDTRTIIDIISIDSDLKKELMEIISEEKILFKKMKQFTYEDFIGSVKPRLIDQIKVSLKRNLKGMGLSVLTGVIDINNIDCKSVIDSISVK